MPPDLPSGCVDLVQNFKTGLLSVARAVAKHFRQGMTFADKWGEVKKFT
jgi:hypothetical protein